MDKINFSFYSLTKKSLPNALMQLVKIFEKNYNKISSYNSKTSRLKSNEVLNIISKDLENLGYVVEKGKSKKEKLYLVSGVNVSESKIFNPDAYKYDKNSSISLEVEAGQAFVNYHFLKDIYECSIGNYYFVGDNIKEIKSSNIKYCVIAVKNIYKHKCSGKEIINKDFEWINRYLAPLYQNKIRMAFPFDGVLIIGY